MKYTDTQIGFQEFPDEISLLINISNCPFHCSGCHSPELWEDVGIELSCKELHKLIYHNKGITCVGFMGGTPKEIIYLAECVKNYDPPLKVGWYWGGDYIPSEIKQANDFFDYIKVGRYKKELGGLDNPNTNQKFYHIKDGLAIDWTHKFWKNEE